MKLVEEREKPNRGEVRVVVMMRTTDRETCPRCGRVSTKRHDARERLKLDESLGERRVAVVVIRRRFRCLGWVLWGREHLTADQRVLLDRLLWHSPLLRCAYLLKEDFRRWYRPATVKDARLELLAWRRATGEIDDLPELHALSGMFALWQEEILNYFPHRVTQGFVEGKNSLAKVFERRAFGYRNVDNLRRYLLLAS